MSTPGTATLLNGRYHVIRPVGRGGMGAVYEAIDLRLRNTVAVKEMTAQGPDAQQAFEREARLLAALRHGALPVVIDYFVEDSSCFLVMQYIEGEDLAALLRRKGPCAEADVQRWGEAVLVALVYLHGLDSPVIHRDIKPSNIKLTPRGGVVLLDFGLAKGQPDAHTRPASEDRSVYGFTPNYAPPEQLQFQGTDARSDLYALGATLYHLAAGIAPPPAAERAATVGAGRPDPLSGACAAYGMSQPLAALITQAMALDPAGRFASAAEMLRVLTMFASGSTTEPTRPSALFSQPATSRPPTRARRVDAATPSRAELDRVIDLLVQVRFADSPRLGLEDWPTRRRPDRVEQASEPVRIEHPVDPSTGRFLPARLRIKLIAPDFEIRGASEQLIDVAPDEYSQRVAFLMTPRRIGYARVNVEVYAAEAVYLGAIAIESEVVAEGVQQAPLCTADLVLSVAAPEKPLTAPPVAMSIPEAADESTAIGLPPLKRAPSSLSSRVARGIKPRVHITYDVEDSGRAPSPELIPETMELGTAAAVRPSASIDPPTTTSRAPSAPPPPPSAAPRSSSRIRTLALALSAAAVLMIAIQVQQSLNTSTQLSAPPATQAPTTPETQAARPPSAGGGVPPSATAAAPPVATATPVSPAPAAPGPPPPTSRPPRPPATVLAPPVTAAKSPPPPQSAALAGVASSSHPGVNLQIASVERVRSGVVRVRLRIANNSTSVASVGVDRDRTRLVDERGVSYQVLNPGDAADSAATVAAGRSIEQTIDFAVPDRIAGSLRFTLAPASPNAARFPTFPVVVQNR